MEIDDRDEYQSEEFAGYGITAEEMGHMTDWLSKQPPAEGVRSPDEFPPMAAARYVVTPAMLAEYGNAPNVERLMADRGELNIVMLMRNGVAPSGKRAVEVQVNMLRSRDEAVNLYEEAVEGIHEAMHGYAQLRDLLGLSPRQDANDEGEEWKKDKTA
jgi:hypothetical protein